MSTYEVKGGVPTPKPNVGRPKGDLKYPWDSMNVGDHFDVPFPEYGDPTKLSRSVSSAGCNYARDTDKSLKYTVRMLREEGVVRVWRVR